VIGVLTAFALSAAQAPAPAAVPGPRPIPAATSCRMIAPNGAVIAFDMTARERDGAQQIGVKPAAGSPWPARSVDFVAPTVFAAGPPGHVVDGAILQLDPFYTNHDYFFVELTEKRGEQRGLTLAQGYCSDAPSRPATAAAGADAGLPFTNPESWSKDCWVIGRDGRRSKLRYRQAPEGGSLTLEPLDREIWSGGAMTVARSQRPAFDREGIGKIFGFAIRETPDGLPSLYDMITYETGGGLATIGLRFFRLSSTAPVGEDAGFGICGLNGVRRGK
jgi:hypothetical protein